MQQDEFRAGSKGTPSKTSKNAKSTKEKHRKKSLSKRRQKMRSRRWNGQGKSLSGRRKNAKPTDKETIRKVDFRKHRKRCLGQARRGLDKSRGKKTSEKRKVVKEKVKEKSVR